MERKDVERRETLFYIVLGAAIILFLWVNGDNRTASENRVTESRHDSPTTPRSSGEISAVRDSDQN